MKGYPPTTHDGFVANLSDVPKSEPVKYGGHKPENMPTWWPDGKPPEVLRATRIYLGKSGVWYHHDGVLVSRKERRRAGVK